LSYIVVEPDEVDMVMNCAVAVHVPLAGFITICVQVDGLPLPECVMGYGPWPEGPVSMTPETIDPEGVSTVAVKVGDE
jgi:hypothetical protein